MPFCENFIESMAEDRNPSDGENENFGHLKNLIEMSLKGLSTSEGSAPYIITGEIKFFIMGDKKEMEERKNIFRCFREQHQRRKLCANTNSNSGIAPYFIYFVITHCVLCRVLPDYSSIEMILFLQI